jgi:tRNA-splicing ligase RtcB (3'-phosphate/5'-hydroxy nucleic acid ligase)
MKRSEKITNTDYAKLGFNKPELVKVVGKLSKKLLNSKVFTKEELLDKLRHLYQEPELFSEDMYLAEIAQVVLSIPKENRKASTQDEVHQLKEDVPEFEVFGKANIEASAFEQMQIAMKLPVSLAGALMPDAHHGYGLPIGGVLATMPDKVIPFAVGVDIACRMCLSIFEIPATHLDKKTNQYKNLLLKNTVFGTGNGFDKPLEDELFDQPVWKSTKILKDLREKAIKQVGSSGTGNHFVEWGFLEISEESPELQLPKGRYLSLLSHSGSRALGANIAGHYSKLAMEKNRLPAIAKHLAWSDLNSQEGQEYWISMNLAGEYASANHHHIHRRMAHSLETKPLLMIENHHNFAWKEALQDGTEVIVHRKGATPANVGELGIIPGSMAKPGFVVKGKGFAPAIFSASHGAGRLMSRTKAKQNFNQNDLNRALQDEGIVLIGGDLDEAPMAYKDIHQVMAHQVELVEILGSFYPKIVRMAEPEHSRYKGKRKPNELDFKES